MSLSIVVPVFDEVMRIGKFLDCLKRQTVQAEVLFVDGGSDDGTIELIKSYGFDVILEMGQRCPANARNQGIAAAKGDIICVFNADTLIEDDYAKKVIDAFEKNPDAECITFMHELIVPHMSVWDETLFFRDIVAGYNGKHSVMRASVWKRLHYDSTMGFGEDRDMRKQVGELKKVEVNETINYSETAAVGMFVKRCLWYGRTIPDYLKKNKDNKVAAYYVMAVLFPMSLLALSPIATWLILIAFCYGIYRMWQIYLKPYNSYCIQFIPFVEVAMFILIGLGFYQRFWKKTRGR